MTEPAIKQFSCPECKKPVVYDPDDPMHHQGGAMLRNTKAATKTVIYLTCEAGHLRRYVVS